MAGKLVAALTTEVLIVGSGLGATALAKALSDAGQRVVIIHGVGCSRSPHLDGGLVDPELVSRAFGSGAPLGQSITTTRNLTMVSPERLGFEPIQNADSRAIYQRKVLEDWGMERAVSSGATYLEDFIEGKALPNGDGTMTLTSERDGRTVRTNAIILCEGADPRIPMRVKLRPDYGPEDQLHFARTVVRGGNLCAPASGRWRTSWGMPVELFLFPQDDGALVSVVSRIENVMRSSRSTADALQDLVTSPAFEGLEIGGDRGETGMELVTLRPDRKGLAFVHDRLVMGIDAIGVIDPRRLDRADLTIQSGLLLADYLLANQGSLEHWPETAGRFVRDAMPGVGAYHDDRATGYIEEGTALNSGSFVSRVGRLIRREH